MKENSKFFKSNLFLSLNNLIIFLIVVNLLIRILKEFSSVDNIYMMINFFFLNKNYFIEDIFLRNSVIIKNDFYYRFLSLIKLNIDNDIHGLILHLFLSITSCVFIFFTIKKIFLKFSYQINLFIILILAAGKSSVLLDGVMSNLLISHSSTPTAFSSTLNYMFIYFLVSKSSIGIIISSSLSFLISIKVGWFSLGVCVAYLLFFEKKKILVLIPTFIFLYLFLKNHNFDFLKSENLELYEFSYNREFYATMFSKQSIFRLILFTTSFLVFYKINKNIIEKEKRHILNLVLFLQILSFFFFIIVENIDFNFFKKWQFIAISPVRSVALYEILFKLIVLIFLFNYFLNLKNNFLIFFFILAAYFFQFGKIGNYLSLFFFALCLIFFLLKSFIKFDLKRKIAFLICILLITPTSVYLLIKDFKTTITFNFFNNEKRFFLKELNANKYYSLKKYEHCRDFLFYDTTGNFYASAYNKDSAEIAHIKNWSSNSIIKKSSFFVETSFLYGNLELLRLNEINYELIKQLYHLIKSKKIIQDDIYSKLKNKKLVLFIYKENEDLFKKSYEVISINNFYSFVLINYSLKDFLKSCAD